MDKIPLSAWNIGQIIFY